MAGVQNAAHPDDRYIPFCPAGGVSDLPKKYHSEGGDDQKLPVIRSHFGARRSAASRPPACPDPHRPWFRSATSNRPAAIEPMRRASAVGPFLAPVCPVRSVMVAGK
jgi:hypothetical protein